MVHALDSVRLSKEDFSTKDGSQKVSLGENVTGIRPNRTFTCLHTGDTFTFFEGDKKTKDDLNKFITDCKKKKQEGFKTISPVYGVWKGALQQAPDNEWMVIEDTERYGITKPPKPRITPDPNKMMIGKSTRVKGEIVYLRDSILGFVPYLKITAGKSTNFPYVPVKNNEGKLVVEPYYAWVIKHEKEFANNPDTLSKAKSKMGIDVIASIEAGKYTYAFNAAQIGQIPLEVSNNEILDDVRYSVSGDDTRNMYKVITPKAPVFVFMKDVDYVSASPRLLNQGYKVKAKGVVSKNFRYRLGQMLNYDGSYLFPVKKLKKLDDGSYQVLETARPVSIVNDKIIPVKQRIPKGMILKGKTVTPVVEKKFSFIVLSDNDRRTLFVKKNHVQEMISEMSSGFEGGDIIDFHGGTLDFSGTTNIISGVDGTERFLGFDSNADIPSDMFDNTKMYFNFGSNVDVPENMFDNTGVYFNFESNVQVSENMFDNTKIDLSFDADNQEEVSNAFGDLFKKIFKRKREITKEQAKKIADPNKVEYSPKEIQVMYEKSGTKKPFKDWLKSDDSKQFFNAITNVGYAILLGKVQGNVQNQTLPPDSLDNYEGYGNPNLDKDDDKKILGLHPVTFGIVSVLGLTALGFGIYFIAKKK